MPIKLNLDGLKYGRLLVLKFYDYTRNRKRRFLCRCDCGKEVPVIGADMRNGSQKSCGCLQVELSTKRMAIQARKHGLSGTCFNRAWKGMVQRCYNPEGKDYHRWGGRGICMCEFIRSSPANLLLLISERPSKNHSVDRKDNNGNYSCGACPECVSNNWPMNIRWATRIQQGRNQRTNRIIEINGEKKCLSEWIEISGLSKSTIRNRIKAGKTGTDLIAPAGQMQRTK